ncbi:MAG: PorP/SprF family type IX secretion system membrane protein [Bacteroidia bacterium]
MKSKIRIYNYSKSNSMRKNLFYSLLAVLIIAETKAQQVPLYHQYQVAPIIFNPAYAGQDTTVNAALFHRTQWKGMVGAPQTSMFVMDGPIAYKNVGIGAIVYNDAADIFQRLAAYSLYSYRLKINEGMRMQFGLSFGFVNNRIDLSRILVNDANDPYLLYNQNVRKYAVDGSFGTALFWKGLQAGFSIPQLYGNKVTYLDSKSKTTYMLSRHLLVNAKYAFTINEQQGLKIIPFTMIRYAKATPFQFDLGTTLDWSKYGWVGVTYRYGYAVGINVGVHLKYNLRAGYAYDIPVNKYRSYLGGAHEFYLGYSFLRK